MESETTQLDLLKERINYDENIFSDNTTYEKVLNRLLEDSKYIALSLRFPIKIIQTWNYLKSMKIGN